MREIKAQIVNLKEWIAELFQAKKSLQAAPKSPDLATLLFRYMDIQREKGKKYSQSWQRQHTADELKAISKAVNLLSAKGIADLAGLDAALSSAADKTGDISPVL